MKHVVQLLGPTLAMVTFVAMVWFAAKSFTSLTMINRIEHLDTWSLRWAARNMRWAVRNTRSTPPVQSILHCDTGRADVWVSDRDVAVRCSLSADPHGDRGVILHETWMPDRDAHGSPIPGSYVGAMVWHE